MRAHLSKVWIGVFLLQQAAECTTPWPLPVNLTLTGGAISTSSISPAFLFSCDSLCSPTCSSSAIVTAAFSRFGARLRPVDLSPQFAVQTSDPSWWRFPGADCDGVQYDLGKSCDGTNISACESLCVTTPNCSGFNTHGILKNNVCGGPGTILPGAGCGGCVDLYLLREAPEPPPGTLTGMRVCIQSTDETLGPSTDESYSLVAPTDGVGQITAPTVFGALHAMESLVQLLDLFGVDPSTRRISYAPVYVEDLPRYSYRGLLVDSSRHFLPVSQIMHTIDAMSYNKLNLLHWHIVDSSSFPCGSETYPALAQHGAYDPSALYSPDDLRAVVAYGLARGVRVLPEWDLPGHGDWSGVEGMMGCSDVINPVNDTVYTVLSGFLGEMAGIFTEKMLFLGGDEVNYKCWDDNSAISAWLKSHNMTSAELQQYFWVSESFQRCIFFTLPFLHPSHFFSSTQPPFSWSPWLKRFFLIFKFGFLPLLPPPPLPFSLTRQPYQHLPATTAIKRSVCGRQTTYRLT